MAVVISGLVAQLLFGGICKELRPGFYAFCFDKPYPGEEYSTIYFGSPGRMANFCYSRLAPFVPAEKPTGVRRLIGSLTGGLLFRDPPEHPRYSIDPKLAAERALDLWQALYVLPPTAKMHSAFVNVIHAHGSIDTLKPLYQQLKRKPGMASYSDEFAAVARECLRLARRSFAEYEITTRQGLTNMTLTALREKLDRAKTMAELAKLLYPADDRITRFLNELHATLGLRRNE